MLEPGAGTALPTRLLLAVVLAAEHAGDRLEIPVTDFEVAEPPGEFDLAVTPISLRWLHPATSTGKIAGLVRPCGGWRRGETSSATSSGRRSSAIGSTGCTATCCPPNPATGTAARMCSTATGGASS